jgi:hypothetical protein
MGLVIRRLLQVLLFVVACHAICEPEAADCLPDNMLQVFARLWVL